jgi:hypothetical protein
LNSVASSHLEMLNTIRTTHLKWDVDATIVRKR